MTAARSDSLTAGGIRVELSNTSKVLFPGDEITKGDLVGDLDLPGESGLHRADAGRQAPGPGDHRAAQGQARPPCVYADIMRNAYAQTAVAPYSVRARPGAPVAVPLHWDEVADRGALHTIEMRRKLHQVACLG